MSDQSEAGRDIIHLIIDSSYTVANSTPLTLLGQLTLATHYIMYGKLNCATEQLMNMNVYTIKLLT